MSQPALSEVPGQRARPLAGSAPPGNRSVLKDEPAECRKLGFGAVFDVTTGELISPPAPLGVAIYPVRIAGDDVEVEI